MRREREWAWWAPLIGMLVVSRRWLDRVSWGGIAVASLIHLFLVGVGLALGAGR